MDRTELDPHESASAERFGAFNEKYAATLRDHVDQPGEHGLKAADALGRAARESDLSMLQLVGMHLEVRRAIVVERGIDRLLDLDAFLSTALAGFDVPRQRRRSTGRQRRTRSTRLAPWAVRCLHRHRIR